MVIISSVEVFGFRRAITRVVSNGYNMSNLNVATSTILQTCAIGYSIGNTLPPKSEDAHTKPVPWKNTPGIH